MERKFDVSRRHALALLAGAAGTAGSGLGASFSDALAQEGYPERAVRVLVPFAPGGPTDVMARLIAGKLSENLGKQFYVDNQGGAGGNIAMGEAVHAAPDGLTILTVSSSFVINPSLYARVPYDPVKDFQPITIVGESPHVFVTHPSVPAKSMKELAALIKAKPADFNYGSPGAGTGPHLSAELFKLTFGLELTHVPFRGAGPAVQSVAGGHNPLACVALAPAVPLIQNGQLHGLGLTSAKRFSTVPDVPTMAEQGIEGQEATTMQAFLVPAKTPKPIIDLLHREIVKVVREPGMAERFTTLGFSPIGNTPAEFASQIRTELARWETVIGDAHIPKM